MSNVSFEEEGSYQRVPVAATQPYLIRLVISWGLVKDPKSAEKFLIAVVVAAVVAAVVIPLLMREKEIPLPAPVVPLPMGSYAP